MEGQILSVTTASRDIYNGFPTDHDPAADADAIQPYTPNSVRGHVAVESHHGVADRVLGGVQLLEEAPEITVGDAILGIGLNHRLEVPGGFGQLPQSAEDAREVVVGSGVVRIGGQRFGQAAQVSEGVGCPLLCSASAWRSRGRGSHLLIPVRKKANVSPSKLAP